MNLAESLPTPRREAPPVIRRVRGLAILTTVLAAFPALVAAHAPDQSYTFLTVGEAQVTGRFEIAVADLNRALGTDLPVDGLVTSEMLAPLSEQIVDYYTAHAGMAPDGQVAPLTFHELELTEIPLGQYVVLPFTIEHAPSEDVYIPEHIDVDYRVLLEPGSDHRGLLVVETDWRTSTFKNESNVRLVFAPGSTSQRLDLTDGSMFSGFLGMVELGTHHILIGLDHILFLVALLLPSVLLRRGARWAAAAAFKPAFMQMVKIVTVFTLAHSVTLSLAALDVISLPSRFVEAAIAMSIAIAALDIVVPIFKDRIAWVVFAFGLFHGMGFASVLGDIGIPSSFVPVSLLAFNIGVEIGQIAVVAGVFPVLFALRRVQLYPRYALPAAACGLILISGYWFTERAFAVDLPAGAVVNRALAMFH